MLRRIITIDREKCTGCGLCASACHEGAIGMAGGKAALFMENFCDGLGDCLPACPVGAITFETREAPAYDEAAVRAAKRVRASDSGAAGRNACPSAPAPSGGALSCLANFPVQLALVGISAPCLNGADLLIAADCTAYALGDFHSRLICGRTTLIGCPKLDREDYAGKLRRIFLCNDIRSITVARMTVPCCGGLVRAVRTALAQADADIPLRVVVISPDGSITEDSQIF